MLSRQVVDLDGDVHYLDSGGDGPPAVLVHGLGGASLNWTAAAELLRSRFRVLAPDLVGFGYTPPAGRGVDVGAQREMLDRFIREVAGGPALIVGNSMGGLISILQAAEAPDTVSRLVLVNPAAPLDLFRVHHPRVLSLGLMAIPGAGEYLARRLLRGSTPEVFVRDFFAFVCHQSDAVDPEILAAHIALAEERRHMPWAVPAFSRAVRSIVPTLHTRRFRRAIKAVQAPTLLIHGKHDRLIPLSAARKLAARRPDWQFEIFEPIGHVPQIECPDQFVETVLAFCDDGAPQASPGIERPEKQPSPGTEPGEEARRY